MAVARSFRTGHFASPICKFLSAFALDRHTSLLCFNVLSANPMKTLTLPVYLVAVAFSLSTALAGDSPNGAKTALGALPPHFAREVVRLSADSGRPNPAKWYVLARNPEEAGLIVKNPLYSITIARGQLSEAKRYLDARQIFNQRNFIDIARVRIDSDEAFQIARDSLGPAGQKMVSASYQLTQTGPAADPIWDVWAYGRSSHYIGVVKLSAKSGDVISSKKAGLPSL